MCVVCVELEHSTHTTHKDTRYTDEVQRKLLRQCHTKKLGGKECDKYKNKLIIKNQGRGCQVFKSTYFNQILYKVSAFTVFINRFVYFWWTIYITFTIGQRQYSYSSMTDVRSAIAIRCSYSSSDQLASDRFRHTSAKYQHNYNAWPQHYSRKYLLNKQIINRIFTE